MHTQLTEVLLILWLNHPPEINIWTPLEPRDRQEENWSYNTFRNWCMSHILMLYCITIKKTWYFKKNPRTCKRKRESSGGRKKGEGGERGGEEEWADEERRKESKDRQEYLLPLDWIPPLKLVCSTWQLLSCLKITYSLLHTMLTFQTTSQHTPYVSLTEGRSGNEPLNCYSPLGRHILGTHPNFEKHVIYLLDWNNFTKWMQNHQVNMYLGRQAY